MPVRALVLHPVLELPTSVVKRPVDCPGGGLGPVIVRRRASDDDLMPGKTEVDGDVEPVPVAVMVARQLDHDVTGDGAVEEVIELLGAKADMGGQRVRVCHAAKRELKGDLHGEDLLPPNEAGFVRAQRPPLRDASNGFTWGWSREQPGSLASLLLWVGRMTESHRMSFYGYVDRPYDAVRNLLRSRAEAVCQRATNAASERTAVRLHLERSGIEVGVDVRVDVTPRSEEPPEGGLPPITHLGISWRAANAAAIFPSMSADLALSPITFAETRVEFVGAYRPPFAAAGRAFDAVVGHRIAELAVHHFVNDLLEQIRRELPATPDDGLPATTGRSS